MRLAVIPARGGSKRIPRQEHPALPWPADHRLFDRSGAARAGCSTTSIVSTDDACDRRGGAAPTAPRCRSRGRRRWPTTIPAPTPSCGMRSSGTQAAGHRVEQVCCVYATAPFVTADDLRAALALLRRRHRLRVCRDHLRFPGAARAGARCRGLVRPMFPQWIGTARRTCNPALHDAGQFYWGWGRSFVAPAAWSSLPRPCAYELPPWRVQDIDTEADWVRAELLFAAAAAAPTHRAPENKQRDQPIWNPATSGSAMSESVPGTRPSSLAEMSGNHNHSLDRALRTGRRCRGGRLPRAEAADLHRRHHDAQHPHRASS